MAPMATVVSMLIASASRAFQINSARMSTGLARSTYPRMVSLPARTCIVSTRHSLRMSECPAGQAAARISSAATPCPSDRSRNCMESWMILGLVAQRRRRLRSFALPDGGDLQAKLPGLSDREPDFMWLATDSCRHPSESHSSLQRPSLPPGPLLREFSEPWLAASCFLDGRSAPSPTPNPSRP